MFAVDLRVLDRTTMRDLLTRYRNEVTPAKRGHASENKRIDGLHDRPDALVVLTFTLNSDVSKVLAEF